MLTIPLLYRWIALAALVAVSMLYAAMAMHEHDSKAQAAFVAGVKAEGQKQVEHTAQIITKQKEITNETANSFAAGIIALRRDYDNKLRASAGRGKMPAVSSTACGADASTADNGLATQVTTALIPSSRALPELCAETTLQLVTLQKWITDQREIK